MRDSSAKIKNETKSRVKKEQLSAKLIQTVTPEFRYGKCS